MEVFNDGCRRSSHYYLVHMSYLWLYNVTLIIFLLKENISYRSWSPWPVVRRWWTCSPPRWRPRTSPDTSCWPGSMAPSPPRRYSQALLSLVELLHYCALIGWELHSDLVMLRQLSYAIAICLSLVLYGIRIGGFHAHKGPSRGGFHARKKSIRSAYNRSFPCLEATYPYAIKIKEPMKANKWEQSLDISPPSWRR